MSRLPRRLSVSGVLALVALFVSLGGVGVAATSAFSGRQIANHTIPLSKLTPDALRLLRTGPNRVATDTGDHFSLARISSTGAVMWSDQTGLKAKRMAGVQYQVTVPAGIYTANSELGVIVTPATTSGASGDPFVCEALSTKTASNGSAAIQIECTGFSAKGSIPASGFTVAIDGP